MDRGATFERTESGTPIVSLSRTHERARAGLLIAVALTVWCAIATPTRAQGVTEVWRSQVSGPVSGGLDEVTGMARSLDATTIYVTGYKTIGLYRTRFVVMKYAAGFDPGPPYPAIQASVASVQWPVTDLENGLYKAWAIAVDPQGNVYVTGQAPGPFGMGIVTLKYNSDLGGGPVVSPVYDGPVTTGDDIPTAIYVSQSPFPEANVVTVCGASPGTGTGLDYVTIAYRATDLSLKPNWPQRFAGSGADSPVGVYCEVFTSLVGEDGFVVVTGTSWHPSSRKDFVTLRYRLLSGSLDPAWPAVGADPAGLRRHNRGGGSGDDEPARLRHVLGEPLLVTGKSEHVASGFAGAASSGQSAAAPQYFDYATVAYDISNGNLYWPGWVDGARYYDGPASAVDAATALDTLGEYVYVTGYSEGSATGYDFATVSYQLTDGNNNPGWADPTFVHRQESPSGTHAWAAGIEVQRSVYVTGRLVPFAGGSDYDWHTIKIDLNGVSTLANILMIGPGGAYDAPRIMIDDNHTMNTFQAGTAAGTATGQDLFTNRYRWDPP